MHILNQLSPEVFGLKARYQDLPVVWPRGLMYHTSKKPYQLKKLLQKCDDSWKVYIDWTNCKIQYGKVQRIVWGYIPMSNSIAEFLFITLFPWEVESKYNIIVHHFLHSDEQPFWALSSDSTSKQEKRPMAYISSSPSISFLHIQLFTLNSIFFLLCLYFHYKKLYPLSAKSNIKKICLEKSKKQI